MEELEMKTLTAEQELLLLTSKLTFSKNEIEEILNLISNNKINWFSFFKLGCYHKTLALNFYNLQQISKELLFPKYLYEILNYISICTKAKNEANQLEIARILKSCKEKNIVCIPVKGAYLIPNIYKNFAIRYSGDIDFLVKYCDINQLHKVLTDLGYKQGKLDLVNHTITSLSRTEEILWKTKMSNLYPYYKLTDNEIYPVFKLDFRFALDDSLDKSSVNEIVDFTAQNGFTSQIHYLVHLCTHFYGEAKHTLSIYRAKDMNLIKLCDIREFALYCLTSKDQIEELLQFSRKYSLEKAIYYSFYCLSLVYNDDFSQEILQRLDIKELDFLHTFGDNATNENKVFKKDFWDRLFSCDNSDELSERPKFYIK